MFRRCCSPLLSFSLTHLLPPRDPSFFPLSFYQLKSHHSTSLATLLQSESTLSALKTQLSTLETQSSLLANQELLFLTQHNTLALKHDEVVSLKNSERTQYALELRELERLEGVNVWSEVFCIGVGGHGSGGGGGRMGNIGGLRLGKGGGGGRAGGGGGMVSLEF